MSPRSRRTSKPDRSARATPGSRHEVGLSGALFLRRPFPTRFWPAIVRLHPPWSRKIRRGRPTRSKQDGRQNGAVLWFHREEQGGSPLENRFSGFRFFQKVPERAFGPQDETC